MIAKGTPTWLMQECHQNITFSMPLFFYKNKQKSSQQTEILEELSELVLTTHLIFLFNISVHIYEYYANLEHKKFQTSGENKLRNIRSVIHSIEPSNCVICDCVI